MESDRHAIIIGVTVSVVAAALVGLFTWAFKHMRPPGRLPNAATHNAEMGGARESHVPTPEPARKIKSSHLGFSRPVEQAEVAVPGSISSEENSTNQAASAFSETEAQILVLFARTDGATMYALEVSASIGVNRLRTDQAIDTLVQRGLLRRIRNVVEGPMLGLTALGRDFVIKQGLA